MNQPKLIITENYRLFLHLCRINNWNPSKVKYVSYKDANIKTLGLYADDIYPSDLAHIQYDRPYREPQNGSDAA